MENYDIRYDDKYGQLTHIDLAAEGAAHDPWFNQTLTTVNDCVVRLAVIDGWLVDWHKHENEDEFFLVLEGRLGSRYRGAGRLCSAPVRG
jgi:mannose-6-phosphate isomerase-like protein (cupin superfamily)